ncbi:MULTISPECIES: AzlD family protein [Xanthobacter]|uniref:AzlD family protein n=1 Tax=Xanthobacter TaxID=279 RepID=UPI001F1D41AF|nr:MULTISPECIES: AzlD domain-containing protein [unclassified Xanthobacter]
MSVDGGTLLAILVMALATVFNRTAGFFLMRLIPVTPRVRKVLDCLPGSVLVALLAPGAVHGDKGMIAGLAAAVITAKLVRNDIIPVAAAMAVAAATRAFLP